VENCRVHPPVGLESLTARLGGASTMWRSLFLALGVSSVILGVEALFIDQAVLKKPENQSSATVRVVDPPELAGGAVVVLYSFTIPRRVAR
jgi:hypothetical protein